VGFANISCKVEQYRSLNLHDIIIVETVIKLQQLMHEKSASTNISLFQNFSSMVNFFFVRQ